MYTDKSHILKRFEEKIIKTNACWQWSGSRYSDGRPRFSIGTIWFTASRVSFELYNGNIEGGLCVCHSCDNSECTNPKHLWLGTMADNMKDMTEKGRRACGKKVSNYGEKNGFYGKEHSPETIAKIVASNRRRSGEKRST